jgi:hypothetical protein
MTVFTALFASLIWRSRGQRSRILITYFSQCAAPVFGPSLIHAPLLPRWHHCCPDWPESRGSGHFLG